MGTTPPERGKFVLAQGWHGDRESFGGTWACAFDFKLCDVLHVGGYIKGTVLDEWRQRHSRWLPSQAGELVHVKKGGRIKYLKAKGTGIKFPDGRSHGLRTVTSEGDIKAVKSLLRSVIQLLGLDTSRVELGWLALMKFSRCV